MLLSSLKRLKNGIFVWYKYWDQKDEKNYDKTIRSFKCIRVDNFCDLDWSLKSIVRCEGKIDESVVIAIEAKSEVLPDSKDYLIVKL